ncbi:acetyl-CoA carboxylase biotin carboxyl carrier protein [Venenivibrio stagnispumantis]|uniref:Biotin carboxyl carrier protein of acetyl-CoA carboxylase n=1 Tax=Venenivibrio stagnispumantis TaxID=407998 RepID=A0AA45WJ26_9AQUI|nr:acetyl-CoA carboxylase biotin carboxyl carrier protein [Venenivibrio stagnispumantis]MCW4572513.1 acetyl-CoA carboxylase biotin carboxyl carrier protein [Venenivibrio stagnispumantis]SMP02109.1 acetyl-CoA carboxylase biotin carboxyl carrier protein [Venenivibrio stagnispumantis]
MNNEFIFEIIERIKSSNIQEIEIIAGDFQLRVKQNIAPKEVPVQTANIQQPAIQQPVITEEKKAEEKKYHVIKSPLVGTFYRAPAPGAPPFVEEGDMVSKGQVVCIIEALKVMNEIESDVDGKVVKILVENGQPVEYGQELMYIEV